MRTATRRLGWTLVFGFTLCVALFTVAVAQTTSAAQAKDVREPNVYDLAIELMKGGKVIVSPKMQVLIGRPARLTIGDLNSPDGAIRIQALARPGAIARNGDPAVDVSIIVLEQMAGAWVVIGEPQMRIVKGRSANVSIGALAGMSLSVAATPKYSERATKITPKVCGAIDEPLIASSLTGGNCPNCPSLPCPDCPNCCSAPCADGTSGNLTCCGSTSCCGCGTCCDPPL